jgi:hypothetical protein
MESISEFVANNNFEINPMGPKMIGRHLIKFIGANCSNTGKQNNLCMYVPKDNFGQVPSPVAVRKYILSELEKKVPSEPPLIVAVNNETNLNLQMRPSCVIVQHGALDQPFSCDLYMRTSGSRRDAINYKALYKNIFVTNMDKKIAVIDSDDLLLSTNFKDCSFHFVYVLEDDLTLNIKYYLGYNVLCIMSKYRIYINKNHACHDALMAIMPEHKNKYTCLPVTSLKLKTMKHFDFFLNNNFTQ